MLLDQIKQDTITAMKAKDSERVGVLRMLTSELKNHEISLRADGGELSDEEAIKVLTKEAKKRKEAAEAYKDAGNSELMEQELREAVIVEEYLPEQMSKEELESIIKSTIEELDTPNFGEVMKAVMPKVQGKADGKMVSQVVQGMIK